MSVVIYVAGSFRGPTAWDIEQNVRRAEEWGLRVSQVGLVPLIPHANFRYFHGQGPDEFWLEATQELLRRCDGLLLIPGWEKSSGSVGEAEEAGRLHMPSYSCAAGQEALFEPVRVWLLGVREAFNGK